MASTSWTVGRAVRWLWLLFIVCSATILLGPASARADCSDASPPPPGTCNASGTAFTLDDGDNVAIVGWAFFDFAGGWNVFDDRFVWDDLPTGGLGPMPGPALGPAPVPMVCWRDDEGLWRLDPLDGCQTSNPSSAIHIDAGDGDDTVLVLRGTPTVTATGQSGLWPVPRPGEATSVMCPFWRVDVSRGQTLQLQSTWGEAASDLSVPPPDGTDNTLLARGAVGPMRRAVHLVDLSHFPGTSPSVFIEGGPGADVIFDGSGSDTLAAGDYDFAGAECMPGGNEVGDEDLLCLSRGSDVAVTESDNAIDFVHRESSTSNDTCHLGNDGDQSDDGCPNGDSNPPVPPMIDLATGEWLWGRFLCGDAFRDTYRSLWDGQWTEDSGYWYTDGRPGDPVPPLAIGATPTHTYTCNTDVDCIQGYDFRDGSPWRNRWNDNPSSYCSVPPGGGGRCAVRMTLDDVTGF